MPGQPSQTTSDGHLGHLDGWRGLAITFLLIGHFLPVPGINLGAVGVSLFFVLSGHLMGRLLFLKETPIPVFYRRRISRIVPAHLCFITCIVVAFLLADRAVNWSETAAAVFFFNNYEIASPGRDSMPFGHIWSLCVEEHSYILLSLIAIVVRSSQIKARALVGAMVIASVSAGVWYWLHYSGNELDFGHWLRTEVSGYGIFVSVLLLLYFSARAIPGLPALVYPALIAGGILLHWWSFPAPVRTFIGVGLFALAVNLLETAPRVVKSALAIGPLRYLGLWSFSIYLWQQPFYLAAHAHLVSTPLALAGGIACGLASFYLLERPARGYLNRVWGRNRDQAPSGEPA
jgi:peptidoglycan/LPS O-acetylase OafA/YrhL